MKEESEMKIEGVYRHPSPNPLPSEGRGGTVGRFFKIHGACDGSSLMMRPGGIS